MSKYIKADGFDAAIIGVDIIAQRIIYCKQKMVNILAQEMDEDEAIEFLKYNTWNTFIGEHTPIYCDMITIQELEQLMQ